MHIVNPPKAFWPVVEYYKEVGALIDVLIQSLLVCSSRMSGGESGDLAMLVKVPGEGAHDSPDAFPLEYGGKLKTGLGIRTSRSYDLLTNAVGNKSDDKTDGGELSHSCSSNFLYGSPRSGRSNIRDFYTIALCNNYSQCKYGL